MEEAFGIDLYRNLDFHQVCQNLYDGIHITDGEGRILFINDAYTRTTGIRPEQVLGRRVSEIEGLLYQGSVTEQVLKTRQRVNSVATILALDKEVLVTGTPVFNPDGSIKLVVTNTRDFPELKRLEQQLSAMTEERNKYGQELAFLRRQQAGGKQLIYRSEAMESVMELVRTVAQTDVTVLITGESGTGKELIANELYQNSVRRDKPFIKVNCAAIPETLLESELFGYEKGAFTGAKSTGNPGKFELANNGTLFLDEIGEMPMPMQVKLLRALQEREITRVGGTKTIKLNFRLITATNRDLEAMIEEGTFREDLFYRISVIPLSLPPLRERRGDISTLANHFLSQLDDRYGGNRSFSSEVIELLNDYAWPGNIRELKNCVERMAVLSSGDIITAEFIPPQIANSRSRRSKKAIENYRLQDILEKTERDTIQAVLSLTRGNKARAIDILGISKRNFYMKLDKYHLR